MRHDAWPGVTNARRIPMSVMSAAALLAATAAIAGPAETAQNRPEGTMDIQDLYEDVRIPKIVVAADGTVLAFARSCRLLRRSTDGGGTWSPAAKVDDSGGNALVDANTGDVLIVSGKPTMLRSADHGRTWQAEKTAFRPNAAGHGTPEGIRVATGASESGITLKYGKHKGRLVMPVRIQPPEANNAQEHWPYNYNTSILSDDGGKTWQVGEPVQSGTGEGTLAELADGRVYYNSRCHMAVDHRRRLAWSHDGGRRWVDWQVSEHLFEIGQPFYYKYGSKPSYGCNAGLVRLPDAVTGGRDVLIYSAPDNPGGNRVKMTVWASFDGAKTWPVKRLVYKGLSAYSSLSAGEDGTIYLLFERGEKKLYETVALARFDLAWLAGPDWRKRLPEKLQPAPKPKAR